MEAAFWDSSSVVPTLVKQKASIRARELTTTYRMVVSWFAPVEIRGSIARLLRTREITANEQVRALVLLEDLRSDWREISAGPAMRQKAEDFVERFPLRSADALQLASAWAWCQGHPSGRPFISGDAQLLDAARHLGFNVVQA
jgi:predicted nucleic acid-binding protein